MNITITNPLSAKNPQDAYILYVKLMHGDADGSSMIQFGPFANDEFELAGLEAILKAVLAIEKATEASGLYEPSDFEAIKGFDLLSESWEYDQTCDDYLASYDGHWLRYFDKNGVEHQTTVTF